MVQVVEDLLPAAVVIGEGELLLVRVVELCGEILVRDTFAPLDLGAVLIVVGLGEVEPVAEGRP